MRNNTNIGLKEREKLIKSLIVDVETIRDFCFDIRNKFDR